MTFRAFQQLTDPQLAEDLRDTDRMLTELRALRRDAVRACDGHQIKPKVCWKIESCLQGLPTGRLRYPKVLGYAGTPTIFYQQ